jgi:hypothetical protein
LPGDFGEEPLDEVVREANNARSCASNRAYTAMKSSAQTLPAWRKNRPRKTTFTKAADSLTSGADNDGAAAPCRHHLAIISKITLRVEQNWVPLLKGT